MTVRELKVNDKVYEPFVENIKEYTISSIHSSNDLNHIAISLLERGKETVPAKQHVNSTKVVFKKRYSTNDTICFTTLDKAKQIQRRMRVNKYLSLKEQAIIAREMADEFYKNYLNE